MRSENKVITQLSSFGFTSSQAIDLLTTPLNVPSQSAWGECFDVRTDTAIWLNDIEEDEMYSRFPPSLYALLQPGYPGQFKFIRKNVFSVLMVVDLTNIAHLQEVIKLYAIIKQSVPIRFGILPYLNTAHEKCIFPCLLAAKIAVKTIYELVKNNSKDILEDFFSQVKITFTAS
jgi:UDP-glucose:glycoprotein glucosyltransferase